MDPEQSNSQNTPPAAQPSMTQPQTTPGVQDVNAAPAPQQPSPMAQQGVDPNKPIETPINDGIQIEGYEPPPGDVQGGAVPPPPPTGGFNKRLIIIVSAAGVVLIGLVVLLIVALTPSNEPEPVVLTYWGMWEDPAVMQTVIDDYQSVHPNVTIQYSMQSPIEYRQRLQAAVSRGEGPDIFRYHNTWVPMLVNELAPIPEEIMPAAEYEQTFYPVAQIDLKVNNRYVGIPLMIDGLLMYYNAQLLDEAGVGIPKTWEEFERAVQTLTIKDEEGTIELAGAAIGTAENVEHFSDLLGLILYQNNANPDTVSLPSLSSSEAALALEYYTLFAAAPNNVWDSSQDNSIVSFAAGNVAFIFAPSWQYFYIQSLNPSLVFGVSSVPQLTGAQPVNWASYWVEGVSTGSPHQEEAFAFLTYLSSRDVMTKLFAESSIVRSFGNPYSRVDLASELTSNNALAPIAESAPTMRSWYMASRTHGEGINDRIAGYFRNAVNAINGGSSAQGELPTVAAGVTEVLGEYGITPQ